MELYLIKGNAECTELCHYEYIRTTDSLIDINWWIHCYNRNVFKSDINNHNCSKPILTDTTPLRENGRILWYRTNDNIFWFFYDMSHIKNIAMLREIKLESLLD